MSSRGVLYIAIGRRCVHEARNSVESLREHMPDIPVTIITDRNITHPGFDTVHHRTDLNPQYSASVLEPGMSPYRHTLFLDTDTYITDDITELFDILDTHDLAAALDPGTGTVTGVPEPWSEYNTGVIAYKQSPQVNALFDEWKQYYEDPNGPWSTRRNQPAFAKALSESTLRVFTLPPRYNCRSTFPGMLNEPVKIVHGRHNAPLSTVADQLNQSNERGNRPPTTRIYRPYSFLSNRNPVRVSEGPHARYIIEKTLYDQYRAITHRVKEARPFKSLYSLFKE